MLIVHGLYEYGWLGFWIMVDVSKWILFANLWNAKLTYEILRDLKVKKTNVNKKFLRVKIVT